MRRHPWLLAGALALSGCLEPMDPAAAEVALVRATIGDAGFTADTVQVRATTRVHAVALASGGYDLGLTGFRFSSSDASVADVDANGTVRGVSPGTATITAAAPNGNRSASVTVVVVPSTIDYTIAVGAAPGAIAFSPDYTRTYVATSGDSVVVIDALGFFRGAAVDVGAEVHALAATSSAVYATHFAIDSLGRIATASSQRLARMFVGSGPAGAVSVGSRVFIATTFDRRLVAIESGGGLSEVPVGGEPHELARSGDGRLIAATVQSAGGWRVALVSAQANDTSGSFAIEPGATAIALDATGDAVYLLYPAERRMRMYRRGSAGWGLAGSVETGVSPGGLAARHVGRVPYVVISGTPTLVVDGVTLAVYDRIENAGTGPVAIRPDGLFAFVAAPAVNAVHVIGL
ncbi:MAG TPA: Ig-like domain-containing protein [Gemmatimonadaceae bacterium]|nr:Ig-like domain-containing protein [Gemmatimonadaceae bacterium]